MTGCYKIPNEIKGFTNEWNSQVSNRRATAAGRRAAAAAFRHLPTHTKLTKTASSERHIPPARVWANTKAVVKTAKYGERIKVRCVKSQSVLSR